jgi:membrane associated rhomboid family serine protease
MHLPPPVSSKREPLLNLPGVVTLCILVLVGVHAFRSLVLSAMSDFELLFDWAVVPARWTVALDGSKLENILRQAGAGLAPREAAAREALARYILADGETKPWTSLTYALLHGSWPHVLLNSVWLAAFGTPVARRCGGARFLALAAAAGLGGALAHALLHPSSITPMIGASAAIAGLMAAAARFVFSRGELAPGAPSELHGRPRQGLGALLRNRSAAMFLAVWFATNLLFGLFATPLGILDSGIAWEAHIGGFVVGFLLFSAIDPQPARRS